jgi:hypothetical protein
MEHKAVTICGTVARGYRRCASSTLAKDEPGYYLIRRAYWDYNGISNSVSTMTA